MYAPHTVTVYYAGEDPCHVTVLEGVFLSENAAALADSQGGLDRMAAAGGAVLFIPRSVKAADGRTGMIRRWAPLGEFLQAADRSGLWSLGLGDRWFFLPGRGTETEEASFARLRRAGARRITRVLVRDFGSPAMGHIRAEGA